MGIFKDIECSNACIKREFHSSKWDNLENYEKFKDVIRNHIKNDEAKTFYKFSDGEYYWLINRQIGSVSVGKRDSNVSKRDLTPFKEGVVKNDYLMCQLLSSHVSRFSSYFKKDFDFPVDYSYASVANHWFTNEFNGNIGLIGAEPKLNLIRELCEKQEYKDYLGFDGFTDYINMPQRYLCDNLDEGERMLAEQLPKSGSKIFLVGIGHAQQALLHRMRKYKNAVFIVVGSGIDSYAGVQDNARPYMKGWVNYELSSFDYKSIDIWKNNFTNKKII